jgi:hypothetical protein
LVAFVPAQGVVEVLDEANKLLAIVPRQDELAATQVFLSCFFNRHRTKPSVRSSTQVDRVFGLLGMKDPSSAPVQTFSVEEFAKHARLLDQNLGAPPVDVLRRVAPIVSPAAMTEEDAKAWFSRVWRELLGMDAPPDVGGGQ